MDPRHFRPAAGFLGVLALLRFVAGCASIPSGRAAVNGVDLHGASQVDASDVTDKLATAPSPKFLGLFRGVVYEYQLFSRATLPVSNVITERAGTTTHEPRRASSPTWTRSTCASTSKSRKVHRSSTSRA